MASSNETATLDQVDKLVLIDASVYAEGTGNLATLPKAAAYAGVIHLRNQLRRNDILMLFEL